MSDTILRQMNMLGLIPRFPEKLLQIKLKMSSVISDMKQQLEQFKEI